MLIKEQSDLVMFPVLRESRVYFLRVFFFFFFLFSKKFYMVFIFQVVIWYWGVFAYLILTSFARLYGK